MAHQAVRLSYASRKAYYTHPAEPITPHPSSSRACSLKSVTMLSSPHHARPSPPPIPPPPPPCPAQLVDIFAALLRAGLAPRLVDLLGLGAVGGAAAGAGAREAALPPAEQRSATKVLLETLGLLLHAVVQKPLPALAAAGGGTHGEAGAAGSQSPSGAAGAAVVAMARWVCCHTPFLPSVPRPFFFLRKFCTVLYSTVLGGGGERDG